jgi:hypothetical protein
MVGSVTPCGASASISSARRWSAVTTRCALQTRFGHRNTHHMAISERQLQATRTARAARVARADARATDLAPLIAELQAAGVTTLRCIADELNRSGIPTPRGHGAWQAVQVQRLLARMAWRRTRTFK